MKISISIHALLAESDRAEMQPLAPRSRFLSTLSLRRATSRLHKNICGLGFLSTLSLRRATTANRTDPSAILDFYPRSPCGERLRGWTLNINGPIFLSTLSLRRATYLINTYHRIFGISIHALLAESDNNINSSVNTADKISIHALLAESDLSSYSAKTMSALFLSTLSLRRATYSDGFGCLKLLISIHALLAESDSKSAQNSGALLRI